MQYHRRMTDRLYLRISLDSAASGSIAKQRAALRRHAAPDAVEYADESQSGAIPFAARPAGARLLRELAEGDRVLVTKVDRCSRSARDLLGFVELVEQRGATVTFTEQGIATEGPTGRFVLTLLCALAEMERALIAERRRESLAAFREEGRHAVGRAPFGLRSVPNPNGRGLVLRPDPDEAPVLRDIVREILSGASQASQAARTGMLPPAFSRLLRNERLAGIIGHTPDGPRLDPDMAVFTLPEWAELQAHLSRPSKAWSKAEGYGPALACAVCGERLYLGPGRKPDDANYRCRRAAPVRKAGAPSVSIVRRTADAFLEREFLGRFGRLPVVEVVTTDSDAARTEAIAVGRVRLSMARRAQDEARRPEEEDAADAMYAAARRALRDAEALPSDVVTEERATGETFADAWAGADDAQRTALLLKVGPWYVAPGRGLPAEEKIYLGSEPDYLAGQLDD